MGIWIRSQNERKDAERMLLREVFQGSGQEKPEEGGVGMDYKDAIRQFECYQKSGWSKSEVPNSACLVLALDALRAEQRCRQIEAALGAAKQVSFRMQMLEAVAEVLKEAVPPVGVDDWWCPTCKRVVDGKEVTCAEYHESCGTFLGDVNNDGWIAKARQVIAALEGGK